MRNDCRFSRKRITDIKEIVSLVSCGDRDEDEDDEGEDEEQEEEEPVWTSPEPIGSKKRFDVSDGI